MMLSLLRREKPGKKEELLLIERILCAKHCSKKVCMTTQRDGYYYYLQFINRELTHRDGKKLTQGFIAGKCKAQIQLHTVGFYSPLLLILLQGTLRSDPS